MARRRLVDERDHRCHFCGKIVWDPVPVKVREHGLNVTFGACRPCSESIDETHEGERKS